MLPVFYVFKDGKYMFLVDFGHNLEKPQFFAPDRFNRYSKTL
jgi:hypothetical protein